MEVITATQQALQCFPSKISLKKNMERQSATAGLTMLPILHKCNNNAKKIQTASNKRSKVKFLTLMSKL